MKDLDFDELDRAVNSLVSAPVGYNDSTEVVEKVLELDPASEQQPAAASIATQSSPAAAPKPTILGRTNTGRFMDFVPQSSSTRVSITAPVRTSRQGVAVTPAPSSVPKINPTAPAQPTSSTSTWPDPIDYNNSTKSSTESMDSPFLSGAKVDKRPLGAFSNESQPSATEVTIPQQNPVEQLANSTLGIKTIVDHTPLPAELDNDLLSIESNGDSKLTDAPIVPVVPIAAPVVATPEAVVSQPVNTPAVSIAQQYQEKPSTGDQKNGAIYDTDSYHKALLHPAKKKSGWLIVLWVSILLVVGAAAGAAVYFLVLPKL